MIRIYDSKWKTSLKAAVLMTVLLLCGVAMGFGQQVVNLTAGPATAAMPDGTIVPMWGYSCGAAAAAFTSAAATTSFTATTATDTALALTPGAYVGAVVTAGADTGVVVSNTATTITVASWTPATPTAGTFSIAASAAACAPLTGSSSNAAIGALGGFYVLNGGSGYSSTAPPAVTITPATGNTPTTPAVATAIVSNGQVVGFSVTNHGAGYTAAPSIAIAAPTSGTTATAAAAPGWSPVVITVPSAASGASLTINLTNNLSFGTGAGQSIPTSIVITGQVGGGLGGAPTTTASPSHANAQGCPTWFIAANPPGVPCTTPTTGITAVPPLQSQGRVQSMGAEVAAGAPGTATATSLTWPLLKPGTYLLESGTHPSIQVPMGLIGVLVVTTTPTGTGTTASVAGTAYPAVAATAKTAAIPAVQYNAEAPLEFSEIDPVQNRAVDIAVRNPQFNETRVWSGLPIDPQGNPGCGNPGSGALYQSCYPPAVNYTPFYYLINGQAFDKTNPARSLFTATAGLNTTTVPPSPVTTGIAGTVLVRLVNAGLRMHVPSIVNSQTTGFDGGGASSTVSGFTLVAEDGNPLPNLAAPRVQTDVFMAAGKTYDVLVNGPATSSTAFPSLPIYDRELSLSANSSLRDAGMLAYIGVNGAGLPAVASGVFASGQANPDTYASVSACAAGTASCLPLVITDPSKGVVANDVNVYGVELSSAPTSGTLTCNAVPGNPVAGICANGTFTYTPTATTAAWGGDSFGYCANGAAAGTGGLCTTVTLSASKLSGTPVANNITYTSTMATFLRIPSPGVLSVDSDPSGLPLQVLLSSVTPPGGVTINMDAAGGFTASVGTGAASSGCPSGAPAGASCYSFTYLAQNSQGRQSSSTATVTLVFPLPSNLKVNVLDAKSYNACNGNGACISSLINSAAFPDYRWIIEEDKTFWVDPNCTTNSSINTPGCPSIVGPSGQSTIPTFGVQFHTSTMDFVAQGCTGPLSCEAGQTILDTRPLCTSTGVPTGCSATGGMHVPAVCDLGNGACRPDPNCTALPCSAGGLTAVNPSQVVLDPSKRYFISVLPGDAANPFPADTSAPNCPADGSEAPSSNLQCGHTMGGASIAPACNILGGPNACTTASAFKQPVNVLVLPTPMPTGKLSALVFEDDFPLNGEQDGGGGNGGAIAPVEPGLGGFNLVLWDTFGSLGDGTGQDSNDMFNQPLSNSLAGTIDPTTGLDACPVSATPFQATGNTNGPGTPGLITGNGSGTGSTAPPAGGMTGMIVTCPKYESDGHTLSPLAGQAVIDHLMPEKFSVQAYPGADRIARGEEWIQTNTLDGQHPHDAFIPVGGPSYFQEYGPAGYHVMIGFANPAIINARHTDVCNGFGTPGTVGPCNNTIKGQVDVQRLSRIPDERLYPSESRDALAWTQCWVSLGDPDGEDFMFTKCDAQGNFSFSNVPGGNWRVTLGDQWNDQIIDGLSTPANVGCTSTAPNQPTNATTCPGNQTLDLGHVGVQQWQSNIYTRTYIDDNKDGIWEPNEIGIPLIYTMVHYRDGHNANALTTDFNGIANFNETFPLFNWYVVEADSTRYKTTGIHTVYDAGGPADGSTSCGTTSNGARQCGTSTAYNFMTNTYESVPLPTDLSVPGAVYCAKADCTAEAASYFIKGLAHKSSGAAANSSTGRIDPPWVWAEGWAGLTGHSNYVDIGKAPYASCPPACATVTTNPPGSTGSPTITQVAENGGIYGNVSYASTRPFDDASQMIQQPWEPNVPNVMVNLYQEGFAADGVTPTLTMVDTTVTSSWDGWAQGFYPNYTDPTTGTPLPYMSCPGQGTAAAGTPNQDLFYFTLFDQPNYLDWYEKLHSAPFGTTPPPPTALPHNSQFKCYDAMKINNQLQPAPYDGRYYFPSSLGINPTTGKLVSTVGSTNGVKASMAGTNCTICVGNPDSTDHYRHGTPMLPPGKYVVQVIMPPGYEVYKEEDKNLLIGDNFIAPVTQQFGGLGTDIFIIPDQASVASMYDESGTGYNGTNYQNSTTGEGLTNEQSGVPGFPGYTDETWPCVGELRVVPDYLSLFPQAKETAPFAGATRPLCDRKEVTLTNQMAADARFFIFTSTHIAAKYTGVITDDFTSEFDPFAPQFGEKFAPPNLPVATRDYLGNEISRVYSDHWGIYNGLVSSSWEVNPPNITGYSPNMMTQCMNDMGPIMDTNPSSPTYGQMIQDPLYNPAYSDFCYVDPFMPGVTTYNDTPVVPTEGFVGAGYNNVDCSYPDATPAISEVDGDAIGPWVRKAGNPITITALGNQQVNNNAYSGPSANVAPFSSKTITRHYGFGSCTISNGACANGASVTIGGKPASITAWSDTSITVTVPTGIPNCAIQQQAQYGGSTAQCGQLMITAGNGKQSVDTVTVTVGGKGPIHVNANQSLQGAIDAAAPGDLLMVDPTCTITAGGTTASAPSCTTTGVNGKTPAAHVEMLIMWKPVRLQGVGAATSIVDAAAFPTGKLLDPWRRHINCLFGLTLSGVPLGSPIPSTTGGSPTPAPYDSNSIYSCPDAGWKYFGTDLTGTGGGNPVATSPQVDRIPLESVLGWDATLNGNLAEQLQEPSLMGAYEGAGVTVLGKGVLTPAGSLPFGTESAYPAGTVLLQNVPATLDSTGATIPQEYDHCTTPGTTTELVPNPYPSNFECNPSTIDGLTVRNSSQGGGGILVHGWNHNLQIANNRVYNNVGTLSGGITLGQAEFPDPITVTATGTLNGQTVGEETATDVLPSCQDSTAVGTQLPYCLDLNVNMHNNAITSNSSLGDELFSGTLAGGGGASFCTGSDYYKFNYNWVCGNISSAEGGGITHLGFMYNGDIEHNTIALNESSNPTTPTNGGGIMAQGTPDPDPICGNIPDADCPAGLSDGTGPNLVINANLIQGNAADSGSGGGIRLQNVNGSDISTFYNQPTKWNNVSVTNNIIVNNIAGWDGAGISLQDALNVTIQNNTIASNDSLATSGVLTQSIGTPMASAPAGSCVQPGPTGPTSASCPQSAGITSMQNTSVLTTTFTGLTITCPTGQPNCTGFSNPLLQNNLIWQNRSFYIGVGNYGGGTTNQQKLISLFDAFTGTAAPAQTSFGQCGSGVSYWDVGVRGDTGPANHSSGFKLNPTWSVLDDPADYASGNNVGANPSFTSQYCNGSRVPPTCTVADGCGGPSGYGVPPGIADALTPNPVFSLTAAATVDEGNNWINLSWGPLALSDDSLTGGTNGNYGGGNAFGNYALNVNSPAIDHVPVAQTHPTTDFFGNPRPDPANPSLFDVGAVEFQGGNTTAVLSVTGGPLTFSAAYGTGGPYTSAAQTLTLHSTGTAPGTGITLTFSNAVFSRPAGTAGGTCTGTLANGATCTINVVFTPTALGTVTGTLTISANVAVTGSPVGLTGTGVAPVIAASLTPATWAPVHAANCPGTGLGVAACALDPAQAFTLTNTGNVPLTGIGHGTLGGTAANVANYIVRPLLSTCGAAGGGQPVGNTTLAAGASCVVTVSFQPQTSQAPGLKPATISVTDAAGTQTATLNGTSNLANAVTFSAPVPALTTGATTPHTGTITVTNPAGNNGSLTLSANPTVAKVGTPGGTFSIATGGTCISGATIAAGGTCTIIVQYTPAGTTTATANVTITGDVGNAGTATSANFTAN